MDKILIFLLSLAGMLLTASGGKNFLAFTKIVLLLYKTIPYPFLILRRVFPAQNRWKLHQQPITHPLREHLPSKDKRKECFVECSLCNQHYLFNFMARVTRQLRCKRTQLLMQMPSRLTLLPLNRRTVWSHKVYVKTSDAFAKV